MVRKLFSNNYGYKVSRVHYVSISQSHLFMRSNHRRERVQKLNLNLFFVFPLKTRKMSSAPDH